MAISNRPLAKPSRWSYEFLVEMISISIPRFLKKPSACAT
jgi:hypothetical protein